MKVYLNDKANFAGRKARSGRVKNATAKQTAAPARQPKNPSNLSYGNCCQSRQRRQMDRSEPNTHLSHLDNAKYASSSFERSLERKGT